MKTAYNTEAEEAVIGSLLIDGGCLELIDLLPEEFNGERTSRIYQACRAVIKINQITVAQHLSDIGVLAECGGAGYLSQLIATTPTSLDVEHYAEIVHKTYLQRQLMQESQKIGELDSGNVEHDLDTAVSLIKTLRDSAVKNTGIVTPQQAAQRLIDYVDEAKANKLASSWGFVDLDRITAGLYRQNWIIVGGRPSMGKSQIVFEVALKLVSKGLTGLFVSLEMDLMGLLEREVAKLYDVTVRELRHNTISEDKWGEIMTLAGKVEARPLFYDFRDSTSAQVASCARRIKEDYGLDFMVVDYIQLFKECRTSQNMHQAVSGASKTMKAIAKELDITVIGCSQLNRGLEHRADDNRRPRVSDFRESGSLEEDADIALLLYRDEYYNDNTPEPGILEIKMAKNRQLGPAPAIKLIWRKNHYENYAEVKQ